MTECPNMRYGLSGAGLVSLGDTLLLTGGVGRAGILKAPLPPARPACPRLERAAGLPREARLLRKTLPTAEPIV